MSITPGVIEASQPRPGFAIIKPPPEKEKSEGGIIYSDWTEKRQTYGEVVSIGSFTEDFEPGDWVLYQRWAGEQLGVYEEQAYVVVRMEDVQATLNNNEVVPCGDWIVLDMIDERVKETASGILIADAGYLQCMDDPTRVASTVSRQEMEHNLRRAGYSPDAANQLAGQYRDELASNQDSISQDDVLDIPPPYKGTILAVGPACKENLTIGATAILEPWVGTDLNCDGKEYRVVREENVVALTESG
jgi:co-chaperonin GroES (HSP10)